MQQGLCRGQFDSSSLGHGVHIKVGLGILQLPRRMMDVGPQNATLIDCVETVALSSENIRANFFRGCAGQTQAGNAPENLPDAAFAIGCWCIQMPLRMSESTWRHENKAVCMSLWRPGPQEGWLHPG